MSQVSATIVVETNPIQVQIEQTQVGVTVEPINLGVISGGIVAAGGNLGELQFNAGISQGIPNVTWDGTNLNLGDVSNIKIDGGTNGFVLQTDGAGNLNWTQQTGGTGNGTPGGANTQIQFNDEGSFGGNAGFTFNKVTGVISGNGAGLTNINASNVFGTVANAAFATQAGVANTANISNVANSVAGANVIGQVANALVAGTVYTNAQPNITSIGTLTSLTVEGTTSIQEAIEKITTETTGAAGNINYDILDQAIVNVTGNSTGNINLNFRGNNTTTLNAVMPANSSMTCALITTNDSTPYTVLDVSVDGTSVPLFWTIPGDAGDGTPNGKDIYHFNILKTAPSEFTVFASRVGYI